MSKSIIMSGVNQIPYDKVNIMNTLKEETVKTLGQEKWDEITANIEVPADNMESEHLNHVTRELLKSFDNMVDSQITKSIFCMEQEIIIRLWQSLSLVKRKNTWKKRT